MTETRTLLAVCLVALVPGWPAAAMSGDATAIPEARADELRHMVRQDCGSCHGLRMTGGLGAAITPEDLADRDPQDLAGLILDGIPGTAMPPWRPLLTEDEALWIADYLLEGDEK
ncbi:c-type cytochrome [Paracoccus jeotgali]|uniref:Cytochrome C556 n=1 Tax=Paracoccus jeotgali TaxID=2065379 RepID=A0A2K9MF14_9RHOB|nr:cytochrome C556 [Paracoccus jeotgali]